ncbi:hypothetical protein [Microbacterium sp. LWH12-1.2]|uniref:hypothetical protein n=1 Tax=Microbacterium sp. LWH12-1.2 TaxID=3135259 RepID=UPI0034266C0D
MTHFRAPAHTTSGDGINRRTVIKAAAWSMPVIAVAVATPLASASTTTPSECVVVPVGGFQVFGGTLSSNGSVGSSPTSDGNFGTGWTPAKAPTGDAVNGFVQTDFAVAPTPASWWGGGGEVNEPGFMSLDDHDNTDGAAQTPVTVALQFAVDVTAGTTYQFMLPIYTAAGHLGTQHLDVSIAGAGVVLPGAVQGYVGNKAISVDNAALSSYPAFAASQTPTVSFTPTSSGTVVFSYTFTLAYVTGGARQNADMLVQAPQLLGCF